MYIIKNTSFGNWRNVYNTCDFCTGSCRRTGNDLKFSEKSERTEILKINRDYHDKGIFENLLFVCSDFPSVV